MTKKILQGISLAFFILPPAVFVYLNSTRSSAYAKISVTACIVLIIALLLAKRFILSRITERMRGMVTQWHGDLKVETDAAKRKSFRKNIARYENILLAFKIPLPTLIIIGALTFLSGVEHTAKTISAILGICSLFWIAAVILLFISNTVYERK